MTRSKALRIADMKRHLSDLAKIRDWKEVELVESKSGKWCVRYTHVCPVSGAAQFETPDQAFAALEQFLKGVRTVVVAIKADKNKAAETVRNQLKDFDCDELATELINRHIENEINSDWLLETFETRVDWGSERALDCLRKNTEPRDRLSESELENITSKAHDLSDDLKPVLARLAFGAVADLDRAQRELRHLLSWRFNATNSRAVLAL